MFFAFFVLAILMLFICQIRDFLGKAKGHDSFVECLSDSNRQRYQIDLKMGFDRDTTDRAFFPFKK